MAKCQVGCTCGRHKAKGVKRSDEVRAKISAAKMGHEVAPETRAKISAAMAGRKQTAETAARRSKSLRRHGHAARNPLARSPEYRAWDAMKSRCYNPKARGYAGYGGRGIAVCDRWRYSFENFLADMGERPSPEHSLDRIDNDGNYEPGNVRWATRSEQQRNRTRFNPNKAKKCEPGCTCRKHSWRQEFRDANQ